MFAFAKFVTADFIYCIALLYWWFLTNYFLTPCFITPFCCPLRHCVCLILHFAGRSLSFVALFKDEWYEIVFCHLIAWLFAQGRDYSSPFCYDLMFCFAMVPRNIGRMNHRGFPTLFPNSPSIWYPIAFAHIYCSFSRNNIISGGVLWPSGWDEDWLSTAYYRRGGINGGVGAAVLAWISWRGTGG